jgi:hypothetical protein
VSPAARLAPPTSVSRRAELRDLNSALRSCSRISAISRNRETAAASSRFLSPFTRDSHLSTCRLNVSSVLWDRWVVSVKKTGQVELRSGREGPPASSCLPEHGIHAGETATDAAAG